MNRLRRRPQIKDDLKNGDDLKNEDDLKIEDYLINEDDLKNDNDLKNEDILKMKTTQMIHAEDQFFYPNIPSFIKNQEKIICFFKTYSRVVTISI